MSDELRPELVFNIVPARDIGDVEAPLTRIERIWNEPAVRYSVILLTLALVWEAYAYILDNDLLLPTFTATCTALLNSLVHGVLVDRLFYSLKLLLTGYFWGVALAALLVAVARFSQIGTDILEVLSSMFNPLPAIALLPLALVWFGLGTGSITFVLVHSVLWPVALNTHSGFLSVSPTLRMVGANYGLSGLSLIWRILVPAAFPNILTGLKIGWAFAWRTLIAAELVFGVSAGSGGIGWFIFENKNQLEIANVYAGLLCVILIGLFVENAVFQVIEKRTIRNWGMQTS